MTPPAEKQKKARKIKNNNVGIIFSSSKADFSNSRKKEVLFVEIKNGVDRQTTALIFFLDSELMASDINAIFPP